MLNKKVNYIHYLVIALVVMIIPITLESYKNYHMNKTFHERLKENRESCYEEAAQSNFSRTICNEIISNVRDSHSDISQTNTLLLTGVMFGLATGMLGLKKHIDELKERLNA